MLESLAYSNLASPRPRPIDPSVFFDLVRVRRLVEDATDLAVRAANGTTASTLSNSLNAGNGMYGGGGSAALGLGIAGMGGPNAKLSKERKHRMRELATQKLSRAYQLDEIAASVATMQSASSLEQVAKLVLLRSKDDSHAKYVHFFHEKIPSRMLAQCTSLDPLDDIIHDRPTEGAPLRTRGVTRILKEDFVGATRDLTDGLALSRYKKAQHNSDNARLGLFNAFGVIEPQISERHSAPFVSKKDGDGEPSSLESQLLFHRAGVYLALACQYVTASLEDLGSIPTISTVPPTTKPKSELATHPTPKGDYDRRQAARKMVKTNAKRALRDYISFLSNFEYTPGLSAESVHEYLNKVNIAAAGATQSKQVATNRLLQKTGNSGHKNERMNDALICNDSAPIHDGGIAMGSEFLYPALPRPEVYPVSSLFSACPPPSLSQFLTSQALVVKNSSLNHESQNQLANQLWAQADHHEAVSYHPLLTDALHSLLLCHCLIQTSSKEHLRHAHMAARLARVCDGYPVFLAARSPSRADWIEVVRRTNNWVGLQQSWESLCTPAQLPGHAGSAKTEETDGEAQERCRQEAIMDALADERVHNEASFHAGVAARVCRAEDRQHEDMGQSAKVRVQDNGKEYPISTERAKIIAKWVREAPRTVEGSGRAKGNAKKEIRKQLRQDLLTAL